MSHPEAGKGRRADVRLSRRLQAVAGMVAAGNRVCDVGCDHGFVSIYLVGKGISPKAIAMDVNRGPLQAAEGHIREYGLQGYIETRLSDGVASLEEGEADTLICAGMGGRLVMRILEEGKNKICTLKELVLQPQSEIQLVREYLRKEGYLVADENMILEEEKYYPIIKALPAAANGRRAFCQGTGNEKRIGHRSGTGKPEAAKTRACREPDGTARQRVEDKYGPILLKRKNQVLKTYLHREYGLYRQILENLRQNGTDTEKRQEEIEDRIKEIELAFSYW